MSGKNGLLWLIFLLLVIFYLYGRLLDAKKEVKQLNSMVKNIQIEAERLRKNEVQICHARNETAAEIKKDKSGFDWGFDYSNSNPIVRLRATCRACPAQENKLHK